MHAIEGQSNVPAFLTKLWWLVEDPNTDDLIRWTQNGRSFIIQDQAKFSRQLLPQYYKHNNMASFVRQLNMYGFHKVTSPDSGGLRVEKDEMEFAHPAFQQGQEELIENIKRKQQRRMPSDGMDFSQIPTTRVGMEDKKLNKLVMDIRDMKRDHDAMSSKFLGLKRENEALWREYATMRQKFSKQQQIIEKLIHFLIAMVKSPSKPIIPKRKYGHLALESADDTGIAGVAAAAAALNSLPQLSQNIELLDGLTGGSSTSGGAQIHEVTDMTDGDSAIPIVMTPGSEIDEPHENIEEEEVEPETQQAMNISNLNKGVTESDSMLIVDGIPFKSDSIEMASITPMAYTDPITVSTTTGFHPHSSSSSSLSSQSQTQNSKIKAFNKMLDEAPLSPELLDTVDPCQVTQSFKYAAVPSPSRSLNTPIRVPANKTIIAGPSKIQISTNTSQLSRSPGKGKLRGKQQPQHQQQQQQVLTMPSSSSQPSMSVAVPDKTIIKNDLQNHMDDMQNSIDSLQEIISSGGFNVDPSVLLSMFGSDDNLNLPDLDSLANSSGSGNELSLYNPSLLDLADFSEDQEENPLDMLNRSPIAGTSTSGSTFTSMPAPSLSNTTVISSKGKGGKLPRKPLMVSIKKEKIDDELSTPTVMSPAMPSPVYRGKKRRN